MILAAFVLVSQTPAALLAQIESAHSKLTNAAVKISVQAEYSYRLWTGPKSFRIDFRPTAPIPFEPHVVTIVSDGSTISAYDQVTNLVVRKDYSASLSRVQNLARVFGQTDILMGVFLEPKHGLEDLIRGLGSPSFQKVENEDDVLKSQAITLVADKRSHLLKRVVLSSGAQSAEWIISPAEISAQSALSYRVPDGAREVSNLKDKPSTIAYDSPETKQIVERSKKSYSALSSLAFTSQAFIFSGGSESKRQTECWWVRGGNFRYKITNERPAQAISVLYTKNTLIAWDRHKNQLLKDAVPRNRIFSAIDKLRAPIEPLVLALLKSQDYWKQFETSDAKARLLPEKTKISGQDCRAVEMQFSGGWSATIHVRESDGLIARIDRSGAGGFSETVLYQYSVINGPIAASVWKP